MRRPFLILTFATCLSAADFWQLKPFPQWTDKEIQRMLGNSPWARPVSATLRESMTAAAPASPGGTADPNPSTDPGRMTAQGTIPATASGTRDQSAAAPALRCVVRWQSALPVRQALAHGKLGAESSNYVIALSGLPRNIARGDLRETILHAKAKPALHPSNIEFDTHQDSAEVFIVFPKDAPFTLDDKEVEFATRMGPWEVKCKFRLKDLLYQGKLEL